MIKKIIRAVINLFGFDVVRYQRDKNNIKKLKNRKWKIFVVWECELKTEKMEHTLFNLYEKITCQN